MTACQPFRYGRVMQDWTVSMTVAERLAAGHHGNTQMNPLHLC